MSERVPVAAVERRTLTGVDPARAWAYVADFSKLPEWTDARAVDWKGRVPQAGDELSTIHHLLVVKYRLTARVAEWEAGRAFRLEVEGLPAALDGVLICKLDAYVEEGRPVATVELRFKGAARRWIAPAVRSRAASRLRSAMDRLERRLR